MKTDAEFNFEHRLSQLIFEFKEKSIQSKSIIEALKKETTYQTIISGVKK